MDHETSDALSDCLPALAAPAASWLPAINASNRPVCSGLSGVIGWEALSAWRFQTSNIPSASSAVPSSFGDRSKGALGKAKTPRAWVVELLCCIVMCHRLKQSRIATKRLGSQSPLQSFQTHCKTMEAESAQQIRGDQQDNRRRCARRMRQPRRLRATPCSFEYSPPFWVETNQCPKHLLQ
jgi:hypothetical protein